MSVFDSNLSLTLGGVPYTLSRISHGPNSATFRDRVGDREVNVIIDHTLKTGGSYGETHMCRVNVVDYNSEGKYVRTTSAWTVIKSFDAVQDEVLAADVQTALSVFLDTGTARLDLLSGSS